MTNITFFRVYSTGSSASTSTVSTSTDVSHDDRGKRIVQSSSSSLYTVVGKTLSAWSKLSAKHKDATSTTVLPEETSTTSLLRGATSWNTNAGEILLTPANLKSFSIEQFAIARNSLDVDNLLGEGRYGKVFRRFYVQTSGNTIAIAVKVLNPDILEAHQGWLADVEYLKQLSHPNLVKLHVHFSNSEQGLLVNEFIPRGSLENYLFNNDLPPLPWSLRVKVALGAAKGLAFLHSVHVIYRDFRISDILLDTNYNAKLSDFGLSKDVALEMSHLHTKTLGHVAPEYPTTGKLTAKCDVYCFGVVLLQLLSGFQAVQLNPPGKTENLMEWAKRAANNKNDLLSLLDSRLEGQYPLESAQAAANLAVQCLTMEAKFRPSMDEVVTTLEQLHDAQSSRSIIEEERENMDAVVIIDEDEEDELLYVQPIAVPRYEEDEDAGAIVDAADEWEEYRIGR